MQITLVHNPSAGFEKPSKEEIIQALEEKDYQVRYVSSKEEDLKEHMEHPGDLVVVAGGDGTIAKVANKLIGRNIPLGILPLGTANNIANTLHLQGLPLTQIHSWDLSKRYSFDIGKVMINEEESHFFESAGFGLLTDLMKESSKRQKSENITFEDRKAKNQFGLGVIKALLKEKTAAFYHILLDGQDFSGKYLMLEVMNIKSIGPHIGLAPDADPEDGYFDIILVSEGERTHLIEYLDQCYQGNEAVFKIKAHRVAHAHISTEESAFHIDDEILDVEANTKIRISLKPGGLSFLKA